MDETERKRQRIADLIGLIQNERDALVSDAKERQLHEITEAVLKARERARNANIAKYQAMIDGLRAEVTAGVSSGTPHVPSAAPSTGTAHAFISYSRKDTPFVERLESDLNRRGIVTWRDATSIPGGDDWYQNIVAGIAGAYAVLCIVSANADESKWVRREQLRADEDGIPPIAIQPTKYRNPLHLQEVQPILMDDANFASGLAQVVAALDRCKAKPGTTASAAAPSASEVPSDETAIQEYLKWVLSEAKADLRDALYVDLAAAPERAPQAKSPLAFGLDDDFTFSSIEMEHLAHDDFARSGEDVPDARKAIHEMRRAVLLGDPGAGKTTTLLKITVDLARAAQNDPNARLPVYVPLREFDGTMSFADFVRAKTHNLQVAFERLSDRFVLLCDALNEMPRQAHDGRDLIAEVHDTLRDRPDWVVSCRVRDYTDDLSGIDDIGKIRLKPLDPPRIDDFIRRKYAGWGQPERGAALWHDLGGNEHLLEAWKGFVAHKSPDSFWRKDWFPEKPYRWPYHEERAWRAMHTDHRRLMMLCRSPFMANMVCALYRWSEKLPDNRAGLFGDFVVNLLRAEEKRLTDIGLTWIGDEPIRTGMGQIAWAMGAQTEMPRADAEAILRQHIHGHNAARVLTTAASAQLIDYGVSVRFTHQLLQQYFAASVLGVMMDKQADPAAIWKPGTWWESTGREETAILLAGDRNDPQGVARWIAPAQPHFALELLLQPDFALDMAELESATRSALVAGSNAKRGTTDPRGRAAAYRVLGKLDADTRSGIGLNADGLPDIEWCDVPAGEFIYRDGQKRSLSVFRIAKYPVTYAQFQCFVEACDFDDARWWERMPDEENVLGTLYRTREIGEQWFRYRNYPRESVSWYQAVAFCRWLSDKLGYVVDLPTEQQWERAARGTNGLLYPYGSTFNAANGNTEETNIGQPCAVGIFADGRSPVLAHDMSGNVLEWCQNKSTFPDVTTVDASGDMRVMRGGSWGQDQGIARATCRWDSEPGFQSRCLGFRVVAPPCVTVRRWRAVLQQANSVIKHSLFPERKNSDFR